MSESDFLKYITQAVFNSKSNNLEEIKKRLNGWQLKSFKESYKHKVKNGISLFKKQNLKWKNDFK